VKIKRIEPIAVSLPLIKPVKMSFEEVRSANNALVRLETDQGIVGWGEAASAPTMTGETQESMVAAVRYLAPLLENMPAGEIADVMARAHRYLHGNHAAKSAIEMALYDALGRATGKPVYDLLGGKRRSNVAMLRLIGTGSTAGDVEEAERKKAEGYVAFKIKVGVADPLEDAKRTHKVCDALGNGRVLVCADANQGWSVDQAVAYVRAVEDTAMEFFEQPVTGDDIEGMSTVARASRIKIGCDEGLHSIEDLKRHHAAGAAHGGSLKTIKLGGMRPVYDAALLCADLGMKVNLACKMAETGIATAAVLQLAAAVPAVDWGVSLTNQYLADDLLKRPLDIACGHAAVPAGPGLGIEVDEAQVRRYARER
jgi:L-alanine-DL-glutamate epimerase-like enolase superfamily enzyme